ncbi:MAG: 30S ribosomal protein S6 [Candidatus Niyogibacteria bacterium]|nr:30S ribosomal protein S6 [Candidatus Niyogibacteria bacterium]
MAEAVITTKKAAETNAHGLEHKLYEFAYILSGILDEEKARKAANDLHAFIEKKHNMVVEDTPPKLRKLAYDINGQAEGYFGWIKFLGQPSDIIEIEKQAKKTGGVLRFLIVQGYHEEVAERRTKVRKKIITEEEKGRIEEIDKKLEEILGE